MPVQQGQNPGLSKTVWLVFNTAGMLCFYTTGKLYLNDSLLYFISFLLNDSKKYFSHFWSS